MAFATRFCLTPVVGNELPFMLFIPAVLVAAWYGGALEAALALVAGFLLAECFFIPWNGLSGLAEFVEIIRSIRYVFTASVGINPEHHQRIFRAFERLHSTPAYEGTGIGLAIVQEGMRRMQGSDGVDSHLGEGSRFWVEFPGVRTEYDIAA